MTNFSRPFLFACALALAASSASARPPAAPAPSSPPTAAMPAPSSVIYIPRLPTPTELTRAAAAEHRTVEQIAQTSGRITVEYRLANGQLNVVAYQLLPTTTAAPVSTAVEPAAPVVAPAAPPAVIYVEPQWSGDPFWYSDGDDFDWGPGPWFAPGPPDFDFDEDCGPFRR